MIGEYLKKHQPVVFESFKNAFQNGRLVHAYLLSGESGTPLKETAIYLAKTLLCDSPNPLADEECRTCKRVDGGHYPDLFVFDGANGSIKKKDVEGILDNFQKNALDKKGIMIYVINQVENVTEEAVNSLLKFLEEPGKNTYAFLTTQNETKVLPTIISRCVRLRMFLLPRKDVIEESIAIGVEPIDAEVLSYFSNGPELVKESVDSDYYIVAKEAFSIALNALAKGRDEAIFAFETSIIPLFSRGNNNKEKARFFFDMLSLAFKDLVSKKNNQPYILSSYATLLDELVVKLPHIEDSLVEIMKDRGQLDLNINPGILIEHLANYLTKETI